MNITLKDMSRDEAQDACGIVREGIKDVSLVLVELKRRNGWLALGYTTWHECCQQEFELSSSQANRIIMSVKIARQLAGIGEPVSVRAATELNKVTDEERLAVAHTAIASGGLTAANVTAASGVTLSVSYGVIELDKIGRQIPAQILPLWKHADEAVESMMAKISAFKGQIKEADEKGDVAYGEINISMLAATLSNVYADLKRVIPHVVCSTCNGFNSDRCVTCKGRGFLSKFYWDNCIPVETKEMLTK